MIQAHAAIALRIGERYFASWRRDGKVFTAWSLAGARLYLSSQDDHMEIDERRLRAKRYSPLRIIVSCAEPAELEAAF